MKRWHMLTVVGRDRPGIVAGLTDALYRGGVNLGEASMARLGGNFTIMLMVESDAEAPALQRLVEPFAAAHALRVHVDPIEGRLHEHVEPNVRIAVHGADRPGIVAQVTRALAVAGCNILDLDSDVGGNAARPIYVMTIDGYVAGGIEALERALAPVRQGGIEVRIAPIDTLVG
jgi:glycine cleavage system transcriptional repressor